MRYPSLQGARGTVFLDLAHFIRQFLIVASRRAPFFRIFHASRAAIGRGQGYAISIGWHEVSSGAAHEVGAQRRKTHPARAQKCANMGAARAVTRKTSPIARTILPAFCKDVTVVCAIRTRGDSA